MSRPAKLSLDELQNWFQDEIVAPHENLSRRGAPRVDAVLKPSATLSARERMDLYSRMYFIRLHDCLSDDYPCVHTLLGNEIFQDLARAYLKKHPSRNYSLNPLGGKFPEFVAETKIKVPHRELIVDVAKLELAHSQVFDAEATPVVRPEDFAAFPADQWERAKLRPIAAFQLLELDHPVNALVTSIRQDTPRPEVGCTKAWIAVYRKDFQVWRASITETQFVLLRAFQKGKSLKGAIRAAYEVWDGSADELEPKIFSWFGEWARDGFFQRIDAPSPKKKASVKRSKISKSKSSKTKSSKKVARA